MENALGSILPQAIGVAISPVPIIAVILMLFCQRTRSNGTAFLIGWVLALVVGSIDTCKYSTFLGCVFVPQVVYL
jgi:Sap, sulfolipid-1-addressing protein